MERRPHPSVKKAAGSRTGSTTRRAPAKAATARSAAHPSTRPARPRPERPQANRPKANRPKANRPKVSRSKGYRPPVRIPLAHGPRRLRVVLLALAVIMSLCGGRLLQLQGFDPEAYASKAETRLTTTQKLFPKRGTITDRNGTVLAESEPGVTITADPKLTTPKADQIADVLVANLGGTVQDYLPALTKPDSRFAYVARKVPAATFDTLSQQMTSQKLNGLFRESDSNRNYPGSTLAAPVVGSVGVDGDGLNGFEYQMNSSLQGTMGEEAYESSPNGSKIPLGTQVVTPAADGVSYQLTLDSELQWFTERRLAARQAEVGAKHGMAVTIDIKTGAVLALASTPGYDAGNLGSADPDELRNHAIADAYEPGSVQKVLTFAAMIDSGAAADTTKVNVPPLLESGNGTIKDSSSHGWERLTGRGILAASSNIGTTLLARGMPKEELRSYLLSFGLGSKTGIELPGEATGSVPAATMPDYTRDQISFGQGISVTTIQEAAAIAGILNGGVYNAPTILQSATDADGNPVAIDRPEPRRIVKQSTSTTIASLMESVVGRGGTAGKFAMDGYRIGAKTGTAERIDSKCKCYHGYTTSFIAMAPAENPQILTYVVFDRPSSSQSGGGSAGPVSSDMLTFALSRFAIWPSSTKGPGKKGLTW